MKIMAKHLYHGAALAQIVEHPSFKALNKAEQKTRGLYKVDGTSASSKRQVTTYILIKHRSAKGSWQFPFTHGELQALYANIQQGRRMLACLVCGDRGGAICVLDNQQLETLIDPGSKTAQTITVKRVRGGSLWARGSKGRLNRAVYIDAFPRQIFA